MPQQIVFLGAKPVGYRCLDYMLSQQQTLDIEVVAVGTKKRAEFGGEDVGTLAAQHGIQVINSLEELPECDILYSVQYHEILRLAHIAKARTITLNLHMAPLPEYRGCNQFSFAIIDGKKEFGTTIHQLDSGIDSGAILFEKRFPIPDGCWVDDLYQLTFEASVGLFQETLQQVTTGAYTLKPQQDFIAERGTAIHYRKEMDGLKQIDLSWPDEKIERYIRATSMPGFEPPYCRIDRQKIYFAKEKA